MKIRNLKVVFDSLNQIISEMDIQTELSKEANIMLAKISDYVSMVSLLADKYRIDKSDRVLEYEQKFLDIITPYAEKEEDGSLKKDSVGRIIVDTKKHDVDKLNNEISKLLSEYNEDLNKYNYPNQLMYFISENYIIPDDEIQYIFSMEINEEFKFSLNSETIEEFHKQLIAPEKDEDVSPLKIVK